MLKLLTVLLDEIFPPSTEEGLLRDASKTDLNRTFQPDWYKGVQFLAHYGDPLIRAAVTENKFGGSERAAFLLSSLLERWICSHEKASFTFIPIPLGKKRMRERGYNQVESILDQLPVNVTVNRKCLIRKKETAPQADLKRKERLSNLIDAFECTIYESNLPTPHHVVLLDDVVTTGATMAAARASLAPHVPPNCKIHCLAIAH